MDAALRVTVSRLSKRAFGGHEAMKERMPTRVSTYSLAYEYDDVAELSSQCLGKESKEYWES
jgi:hypothetical protein